MTNNRTTTIKDQLAIDTDDRLDPNQNVKNLGLLVSQLNDTLNINENLGKKICEAIETQKGVDSTLKIVFKEIITTDYYGARIA